MAIVKKQLENAIHAQLDMVIQVEHVQNVQQVSLLLLETQ